MLSCSLIHSRSFGEDLDKQTGQIKLSDRTGSTIQLITEFISSASQGTHKSYPKSPGQSSGAQVIHQPPQTNRNDDTHHSQIAPHIYKHKYLVLMGEKNANYNTYPAAGKHPASHAPSWPKTFLNLELVNNLAPKGIKRLRVPSILNIS